MNITEQQHIVEELEVKSRSWSIQESLNFFQGMTPWLGGYYQNPGQDGTLWQGVGYPPQVNPLLYLLESAFYNRLQRYLARYLFKVNSYAISAIGSLGTLVLGHSYKIVCDTDAGQRRIDEWWANQGTEDYPDYSGRALEAFERYLVDGECYLQVFGQGPSSKVRFIDPDCIHNDNGNQGINLDPDDYETVLSYSVKPRPDLEVKTIPAARMQHRKAAWGNSKHGFSYINAVYQNLMDADSLLHGLAVCADAQARFVAQRKWESDKDAVATVRGQIQAQTQAALPSYQTPNVPQPAGSPPNIERYPYGSIIDSPKGMTMDLMTTGIQGDEYVTVLRAILRQVASRFGLPEAILSQDQDSVAAYSAAMVTNSYLEKGMQRLQNQIFQYDLKLLQKCGFDIRGLSPDFAEIAIPNKKEQAAVAEFLLDHKIASKETIARGFQVDYCAEKDIIKREYAEEQADEALQQTELVKGETELVKGEDNQETSTPTDNAPGQK